MESAGCAAGAGPQVAADSPEVRLCATCLHTAWSQSNTLALRLELMSELLGRLGPRLWLLIRRSGVGPEQGPRR